MNYFYIEINGNLERDLYLAGYLMELRLRSLEGAHQNFKKAEELKDYLINFNNSINKFRREKVRVDYQKYAENIAEDVILESYDLSSTYEEMVRNLNDISKELEEEVLWSLSNQQLYKLNHHGLG